MPLYYKDGQKVKTSEDTRPCPLCGNTEIAITEVDGCYAACCMKCGKRAPGVSKEKLESVVAVKLREAWQLRDDLINRDWNDSDNA